jgi:hypothetical protein
MLSEQTAEAIRRLIADLIANPGDHRWGVCRDNARRLGALPVHGDFGGNLFVTPDGRVLSVPDLWDHLEGDAPWPAAKLEWNSDRERRRTLGEGATFKGNAEYLIVMLAAVLANVGCGGGVGPSKSPAVALLTIETDHRGVR